MESTVLLQAVINGLLVGALYVLFAAGFSLIFGILDVVNFAHGEMYMLGGFVAYYLLGKLGCNFFLALLMGVSAITLLGMVLEPLILRPQRDSHIGGFIVTLGLVWVLQQTATLFFGPMDKAVPSVFTGTVNFLNVSISVEKLVTGLIGFALVALLFLFIGRTKIGKCMRAVTQDREAAWLQGINADFINCFGFGLGCGLAAAAGVLMAPILFVSPTMGNAWLFKAFIIVILGGLGSIPGAVVGGLLVGLLESLGCLFMGLPAVQILLFSTIILIMRFKPKGLFGHE